MKDLENYGMNIEKTTDRLASFYEVTNTYLSVFGVFGALGMISGIAGLGFVLLRNYNQRKQEFALMLATGFHIKKIRQNDSSEQVLILFAGVSSGIISALVATSFNKEQSGYPMAVSDHDDTGNSYNRIICLIIVSTVSNKEFINIKS